MRFSLAFARLFALVLFAVFLAACSGKRGLKPDMVQAENVPSSFDVTLVAAKDSQFDLEDAPLTAEDLKSALRYRQEEKLPMSTVLLKRGEKQKIKKEHIIAFARIAYEMKVRAYIEEDDGTISEVRAQARE